ncbi:MAG: hypothetical protein H6712_14880 [Myxococcales bacterium]|nr:hypothetical protein [Myxococcales bacterium]
MVGISSVLLACLGLTAAAVGAPEPAGDDDDAAARGATGAEGEPDGAGEGTEASEPEPDEASVEASPEAEPVEDAEGSGGGAGAGGGVGANAPGSDGAGPVDGSIGRRVESDDPEVDEDEVGDEESDRRRRRGNRSRPDEGEWRVFAPYPELGPIRYRDPELRRTLWLGLDASGAYVPTSLGLFDRTVWTIRPAGAWALALTPWLAVGGRHSVAWYDADNIRVRVHSHQAEISGRPLAASRPGMRLDDRLALGVTTHAIRETEVDGLSLSPGGLFDTIVHIGYGLDHLLGTRWRLGWKVQGRYAWVYLDTQRQARASMRLAFHPRPPHRLSLDAVGYYVNRDPDQAGNPLPRNSFYGQVGLGYSWISRAGVGPWTQVRATSGFMSGEAPVYEIREEAINAGYGEVLVGMLARWP